jgi:hypothetical protein
MVSLATQPNRSTTAGIQVFKGIPTAQSRNGLWGGVLSPKSRSITYQIWPKFILTPRELARKVLRTVFLKPTINKC